MLREDIAKELKELVGEDGYLESQEDLVNYSYDAYLPEALPHAVLLPRSTEQVASIMRVAYRESIPVTPRGPAPI